MATPKTIAAEYQRALAAEKALSDQLAALSARVAKLESVPPPAPPPVVVPPPVDPPPTPTSWDGFGGITVIIPAPVYRVVSLANDPVAGTLRFGCGLTDRHRIVFDVEGTINNATIVDARAGHFIEGQSAPGHGITLTGRSIRWSGKYNDIYIGWLRMRGGSLNVPNDGDNLTFINGPIRRVTVDHLSLSGNRDEALGIWRDAMEISVLDCLFGPGEVAAHNYGLLNGQFSGHLSVFRNAFIGLNYRNPAIGWDDATGKISPDLTGEVINNVVYDYGGLGDGSKSPVDPGYGTSAYWGGKVHIINNVYRGAVGAKAPIEVTSGGTAYVAGNMSLDGKPFPASTMAQLPVGAAAIRQLLPATAVVAAVKANVGCRVGGLDAFDTALLARIAA